MNQVYTKMGNFFFFKKCITWGVTEAERTIFETLNFSFTFKKMTKKIQQFIVFYFSLFQNKTPRCNTTYYIYIRHIDVCHHSIISSSSCARTSYFRTKFLFSFFWILLWRIFDVNQTEPKKALLLLLLLFYIRCVFFNYNFIPRRNTDSPYHHKK